jgi:hypothetical protein
MHDDEVAHRLVLHGHATVGFRGELRLEIGVGKVRDQSEVSGMHHDALGGFASLRPAIDSTGKGAVLLRDFVYRAWPG